MRRGLALHGYRRLVLGGRLVGLGLLVGVMMIWGWGERWMAAAQMPVPQPLTVVVAEVLQKTVPVYDEFVAHTEAL